MSKKKRRIKKKCTQLKSLDYYIDNDIDSAGFTNSHHLTPRSKGGSSDSSNILRFDALRHLLWHKLFGNKTLEQVIALLQRMSKMKGRT